MKFRGFTLVELLVVLAIIAILAAMLAPVLIEAQDAARIRSCAGNIRQLGSAITRYMDDYDGLGLPPPPTEYNNAWVLCVKSLCPSYTSMPYLNLTTIRKGGYIRPPKWLYVCPGDTARPAHPDDVNLKFYRPCWWRWGSSYMYPGPTAYMRTTVTDPNQDTTMNRTGLYPVKPSLWRNHRRDMLLADFYGDYHCGEREMREESATPQSLDPPLSIKVKTCNVVFLDLHLKTVTPKQRGEIQQYTRFDDNPFWKPPVQP